MNNIRNIIKQFLISASLIVGAILVIMALCYLTYICFTHGSSAAFEIGIALCFVIVFVVWAIFGLLTRG